MRALRILGRNIRDAVKSVFRNFSLSLASITCITITLIVVSISMILSVNVNNFADMIKKDVTIITFLKAGITEEEIDAVKEEIEKLDNIASIEFKSKMDNMKDLMDSSEVFNNIMKDWTSDESPIVDTFLVKVKDVEYIDKTANDIKIIPNVTIAKYGEDMIGQMITLFDAVKKISYGTVLALVVVTAFLISNTIKITIFSRRREIEIMRLVGASNINIKIPFIFEGLFLGLLGAIIPIIASTYGYSVLYTKFDGKFLSPLFQLVKPEPFIYYLSGILIAIGIVVGMLGSYRAVRKYLKI